MPIVDLEQIERKEQEELKLAQDALDAELAEVKTTSGNIPEKYRGKSLEDVIAMNEELVRKNSRLGNEVGQLRKLRETVDLQPQQRKIEKKEVNVDALLENPEQAVETVIGQSDKIRELEEKVEKISGTSARREFESAFPDYEQDLQNEEFIEWAMKDELRRELAYAADKYDFKAAKMLWNQWSERQELIGEATKQKAEAQKAIKEKKLRDGTLESGTGNSTETKKVFSRREIRDIKTRALQGDRAAEAIVNDPEWQRQTMQAYLDKRAR
jgi:hypothetical protein